MMGYVIGKAEGKDPGPKVGRMQKEQKERHGHVTAITVAPEYRRLGVAKGLMGLLESASSNSYKAYFVDLFVRPSNQIAIGMYEGLGYSVYRKVDKYYQGGGPNGTDEDGYDMRKALARDSKRETVRDGVAGMAAGSELTLNPPSTIFLSWENVKESKIFFCLSSSIYHHPFMTLDDGLDFGHWSFIH
ncbi:hypothetical protein IEQ34_023217 [Dendrobium chrysotoxum]|uniref:N-acetyltransferase domain-containing protein n=1 Tax=Dendrobium chrysotoxum TaxID=161865 RepID=A0AAV7FX69_DENCH|nr:hypothetical protein IEQ34_023217 [Dendrobium chrysotoxum]